MTTMAESIPNKVIHARRNLPWLNKTIIRSVKKRNLLFKQAKRTGDYRRYKTARNGTLAQLRLARRNYFRKLNPKEPKNFWKAVKCLNKNKQTIPTLSRSNTVAYTDSEKANLLLAPASTPLTHLSSLRAHLLGSILMNSFALNLKSTIY